MGVNVSKPSKPGAHTAQAQSEGSKQIKIEHLSSISTPADIGKAPPSRIYTRDYSKAQNTEKDDLVGPVLGNPLRW